MQMESTMSPAQNTHKYSHITMNISDKVVIVKYSKSWVWKQYRLEQDRKL